MSQEIVSKVLVLENDPEALQIIKRFCEESGLVGLTADKRHLNKVLGSTIDLGAILFAEHFAGTTEESTQLARTIHALIPLDSVWCRGFMVLQTEEAPLLATMGSYGDAENEARFRQANSLLGEITNLIWGSFKNRFIGDAAADSGSTIQVPIVVNQKRGHMSFGTDNPELCFRYRFKVDHFADPVVVYQRLTFNLHWAPEGFREIEQEVADLVDSGELEMF